MCVCVSECMCVYVFTCLCYSPEKNLRAIVGLASFIYFFRDHGSTLLIMQCLKHFFYMFYPLFTIKD